MAAEAHPVGLSSGYRAGRVAAQPASTLALRIGCFGIAALSTAAGVVGWVLFDTEPTLWTSGGYWPVREMLSAAVVYTIGGAWLIGYRPARWPAVVLIFSGMLAGLALLFDGLWWNAMMQADPSVPVLWVASGYAQQLSAGLIITVLPQLYPDGPLAGRRWRVLLAVSLLLVLAVTIKSEIDIATLDRPTEWFSITFPLVLLGWLIALLSLAVRFARGSLELRHQIIGFAGVIVIMVVTGLLTSAYPYWQPWLIYVLAPFAVVAAIAVAVLRYRLYEVRLVVRRAAVYAALTAALTVLFVAVYIAVSAAAGQLVEGQYRWAAAAAATGAIVLVEPLRRRLQASLELRLLGFRSDPLRVLTRLHRAVAAGDAEEQEIYTTIAGTVAAAVQAPSVSLAVQRGPEVDLVAVAGRTPTDEPVVWPLVYRGERLGEIRVDPRTPGESYGRADSALLAELANQASALVHGARRDAELVSARRDSMTTVAEERKRLGRDLHDSIAPLLAGAGLTAEALRQGMEPGSADERDARQLASRLRTAAGEVRRLAHDLQPAASVTDRGLEAVLADFVATLGGAGLPEIRVSAKVGPELEDGVAQAAYLVTLEAINNVIRHAHATRCDVTLRTEGNELLLRVVDDGRGLADPYISGIGMTSMRSRVQALGGTFSVENRSVENRNGENKAGAGTELRARIPVTP